MLCIVFYVYKVDRRPAMIMPKGPLPAVDHEAMMPYPGNHPGKYTLLYYLPLRILANYFGNIYLENGSKFQFTTYLSSGLYSMVDCIGVSAWDCS